MEDRAQQVIIASLPYTLQNGEGKREAMRQYKKQWREANKANIKTYRLAYMEKNNNLTRCEMCGGGIQEIWQVSTPHHQQTQEHREGDGDGSHHQSIGGQVKGHHTSIICFYSFFHILYLFKRCKPLIFNSTKR